MTNSEYCFFFVCSNAYHSSFTWLTYLTIIALIKLRKADCEGCDYKHFDKSYSLCLQIKLQIDIVYDFFPPLRTQMFTKLTHLVISKLDVWGGVGVSVIALILCMQGFFSFFIIVRLSDTKICNRISLAWHNSHIYVFFFQGKMKSLMEDWRNLFSHQRKVCLTNITSC